MADWSELPSDLISKIAKQIDTVEEFVAFSCVCRSWRSDAVKENWIPGRQLPWLMLAEEDEESNRSSRGRGFYHLYKEKFINLELPEARGKRCWGSPHGWLFTIGSDPEINLLNPLTRTQIRLPPQSTFQRHPLHSFPPDWYRDIFISKAIIVKELPLPGNDHGFLVVTVYGLDGHLAFARPGDESWTSIHCNHGGFEDVLYYNGQIFALHVSAAVYLVKLDGPEHPKVVLFAKAEKRVTTNIHGNFGKFLYLANVLDDLLVVVRFRDSIEVSSYGTKLFMILKLDSNAKEWIEVDNLGDYAIFLGRNFTFCLRASEVAGCKGNSIYFTDDSLGARGYYDMGVFSIKDKSIHPHYLGDFCLSLSASCSPLWIMPSLF